MGGGGEVLFFFLVVHDKVQSLGGGGFEVPKVTQLIVLNQAYKLEDLVSSMMTL